MNDELMACCPQVGSARIIIKLDIYGLQINAKYVLLHSFIRIHKALKIYQMTPRRDPVD